MKEYEKKAQSFSAALQNNNMEGLFEKIDADEATGFRATQNMNNGRCVILVVFDNSIYSTVTYTFSQLENVGKKEKMLSLLNDLNQNYKTLKFFIDDDNEISGQFMYMSSDNKFDGELMLEVLMNSFQSISNTEYAKIMRIIWS